METSVKKIKNLPLRKYLVFSVLITLAIIVLLSAATIFGCMTFRKYLLPESNNVFLTVDETYADGTNVSYSGSNVRRWNGCGIKANKVYNPTD